LVSNKRQLFLDTNVCGKLTVPPYAQNALRIMGEVRRRYRIAVAATTVIELLRCPRPGMADEHFQNDQKKFRVCTCGDRYARYMGLAADFAISQILGVTVPDRIEPTYFRRHVKAMLKAGTQAEFFKTFEHDKHEQRHAMGVSIYREWLTKAKSSQYRFPTPERWGVSFWEVYGVPISEAQGALLAENLSALYAYQKAAFEIADANPNLNTQKRDSDWSDAQQLVYLSEPDMHLLTDDAELKQRASASKQSDRILILSDFIRDMGL
jgi:hypothetical protein